MTTRVLLIVATLLPLVLVACVSTYQFPGFVPAELACGRCLTDDADQPASAFADTSEVGGDGLVPEPPVENCGGCAVEEVEVACPSTDPVAAGEDTQESDESLVQPLANEIACGRQA